MADPRIPQGNLNRLKASLIWADNSDLNITPPFMGRAMFSLSFEGAATSRIPTSTGLVNSPEPYQGVMVTASLLRTQQLATLYEQRRQTNTLMGDGTLRPDSQAGGLGPYQLINMSIENVREMTIAGEDPTFVIVFGGYMQINSFLWG